MPRQTVQVRQAGKFDNILGVQKFRSINEIKREQEKIASALNSNNRTDMMQQNSNVMMIIGASGTAVTSAAGESSGAKGSIAAPSINVSNMHKY